LNKFTHSLELGRIPR